MNKNGEKEGKRSKGQKKEKPTKVNKPKGGDNKPPADDKCPEADDFSNKFPNFCLLNEEERQVFFQALTVARKNVERRGVTTREKFGTVHDEYLKYFNQEQKEEEEEEEEDEEDASEVTTSLPSKMTVLVDNGLPGREASQETKSRSPTLLLEGFSGTPLVGSDLLTVDPGPLDRRVSDQCESVIQQDTDKVLGMYLNKKKRNEAKSEDFRPEGKKPDQAGERKASKLPKRETGDRAKKPKKTKESTLAYQVSETPAKASDTPRFDALSAEEKDMFFDILQEARNNILGKNPERKGEILPLEAIVKRYKGDQRPATSVYASSVQESRKRCEGKKNLRVKVTLTSGDNERVQPQKTKSEELCEMVEKKLEKSVMPGQPSGPEKEAGKDVEIERICENEPEHGDLNMGEQDDRDKPKEKASSHSVGGKLQESPESIDIKSSPEVKNTKTKEEKSPPVEAQPSEEMKKESEKPKKMTKNPSYYMTGPKPLKESQRPSCPRGKKPTNEVKTEELNNEKPPPETGTKKEKQKKKKKRQEETEAVGLQEPLYEGNYEELPTPKEQPPTPKEQPPTPKEQPPELEQVEEEEFEEEDAEDAEEEEEKEKEKERSSPSLESEECRVGSSDTYRMPKGEDKPEGSYTCAMQVSSAVVQTSQEIAKGAEKAEEEEEEEEEEKKEEEKGEKNEEEMAKGSWLPGDAWWVSSKDKHSLTTVKSLFLGEGVGCSDVECSGGEAEGSGAGAGAGVGAEGRRGEAEGREFLGVSTSPKVMIVDDNVIEKIRKLIYYLEAKAGKDDRLEKEYMKLLVDYVDYLSKVLETLVHKKERRKQVQSVYPAKVSVDGNQKKKKKEEEEEKEMEDSKFLPRSVSAQDVELESLAAESFVGLRKKKDAPDEKSTTKSEFDALSASMLQSDSDSSLQSVQEVAFVPPSLGNKKVVTTKIRLLQDLLKQRAEFVQGSTDELKILHHPQKEFVPVDRPPTVQLITEEDEEHHHKRGNIKFLRTLMRCFTCGKKKDEEDGIFDNLRGEAVRVDVCEGQTKDPANATLNLSTMEVLKAAGRKRIIEKYYGKI